MAGDAELHCTFHGIGVSAGTERHADGVIRITYAARPLAHGLERGLHAPRGAPHDGALPEDLAGVRGRGVVLAEVDAARPGEARELDVVVDGEEGAAAGADLLQLFG